MNNTRARIAIVGGSIAGLIAGLSLLRRGFDVTVFGKGGDELASHGGGITPHQPLFDAFQQEGIAIDSAPGVRSKGRSFLAEDGRVLASNETQQVFVSWGMLYRILRHAIPERCYRAGRELVSLRLFEHGLEL